jgi:ABC-2 type transport system permease protein
MIPTLLRIGWLNLKRDRVAQALTFLLPVLFFSIFALVFGQQRDPTRKVNVAVVDEDGSEYSKKLMHALRQEGGLRVRTTADGKDTGATLDRASAEALVRQGDVPVAVILPKGIGARRMFWRAASAGGPAGVSDAKVQLLADVSDPVAPQMVLGLLQKVSFTAAPDAMAVEGLQMFEKYTGPMTPAQKQATDSWLAEIRQQSAAPAASASSPAAPFGLPTEIVNVMQPTSTDGDMVAFYAAGVGVMFLLFSASGAGGTLLDEEESGTLGRLIGSGAGMWGVLVGKWIFFALTGALQLTVMFTWGMLVFKLPLLDHLPGFLIMTACAGAAASAFGLMLATLSRTRQQLSGMSTIIILTMSALGGSMFPRFLMSETMQKLGLVTFNAWALDGYLKVFWRQEPVAALWPQILVLVSLTAVFLGAARTFARRWEAL